MFSASILSVAYLSLSLLSSLASSRAIEGFEKQQDDSHWINTWASMPQLVERDNLPPAPFSSGSVLRDATLRQTFKVSVGAPKIKITISNTFGGSDLPITAGSVGLPTGGAAGERGIQASPLAAITVGGKSSFTVPKGQVVTSDEIAFEVKPQSVITVSLYSQQGKTGTSITGHPGSRTTSWLASGNKVNATSFSGTSTVHWYFVSAVQALVPTTTNSLITLGDSITDGRGSTDNENKRWPDLLFSRLQTENYTDIAINNEAAGGNAVLSGGLGPTLLTRYKRDALLQPGAKYIMIFEGVNDIGPAANSASVQKLVGDRLIAAFTQIAADAKKAGFKTIGATITPFGNNAGYAKAEKEKTRLRVNEWVRAKGNGSYDYVVDFARMVAAKGQVSVLDRKFDSGDGLHPNVAGYQAMADGFPVDMFRA